MVNPIKMQCPCPGCNFETEPLEQQVAIEFLKLHVSTNHGNASKPEKPKRPLLSMPSEVIESRDWAAFKHQFDNYKKLANISGEAASHLLECLSPEVYKVLYDTFGDTVNDKSETELLTNIEHLVVRKRNKLASVMELLNMKQDVGQKVLNFLSQLKSKARHCQLQKKCTCAKLVDYTEDIVLFRLVAGVADSELQEDLLKIENLTLTEAEKQCIAKESAKSSQAEIVGDSANKIKSQYSKSKQIGSKDECKCCGGSKHKNREKDCPAFGKECLKCGRMNHFQKMCLAKTKIKDKTSKISEEKNDDSKSEEADNGVLNVKHCGYNQKKSDVLSQVSTADLIYNKQSKKWVQRPDSLRKIDKLGLDISVCKQSFTDLGSKPLPDTFRATVMSTSGIADTGCSVMCAGDQLRSKLKVPRNCMLKSGIILRTADGKKLTVLGAIPVTVTIPGSAKMSKQLLHIVQELTGLFISKLCLADLGSISKNFPHPESCGSVEEISEIKLADCGCPIRERAPDPPKIPFEPILENIPKLKEFLTAHYASSTMNLCPHQQLPEVEGPPLKFLLKENAVPRAVFTPATLPVHWMDAVKAQLDRDVDLGVLEKVPPNEPTIWQHRMVVVRKANGSPRRTVDMKALNEASVRQSHVLTSPYEKAMMVPSNVYKTVTDAWEGFHGIPLDEESKKLTQFITPWGSYRYKRGPQGYQTTPDAYNMRFDSVTKDVKDVVRQMDDSLLWAKGIKENFEETASYLTLLGRNGILQNPAKFQFCQEIVTWSGFEIGKDYVKPMSHISGALRNFPVPANKTDLRAFMALAQQVSYATAVAPKLLPFRSLLRKDSPWDWTPGMDRLFLETRQVLADMVDEGMKMYDPKRTTALVTDFCKHGVGFVLMQKHCNCPKFTDAEKLNTMCCKIGWKVCMVGSRFTKKAEANYSPTEGELLAIVNALQKTKFFTLGCPDLYICTDHKPLLGLLGKLGLENMENPRLLRLKEKTTGWQFTMVYIPGKEIGGTDTLSRYGVKHSDDECQAESTDRKHLIGLLAGVETDTSFSSTQYDKEETYESVLNSIESDCEVLSAIGDSIKPISWTVVRNATNSDVSFKQLMQYITGGFPDKQDLPEELLKYWSVRMHLSVFDGVIMCGDCVVIPKSLRGNVLQILHSAHQGTTSMSLRANKTMYWPGMHTDIIAMRKNCSLCHSIAPSQPDLPPITPEAPSYPFQHVCSDYFQLHGSHFCVVVDRFSGWFNIHTGDGGSKWLTKIFHRLFQDVGIPETLTTDGGTTYMSSMFQDCLKKYGIHHRVSSVGFPHGNCRAEVAVKTAKRLLRAHMNPTGTLETVDITKALLQYRNTPDRDTGISPAQMLYGRKLPDFLPNKPKEFVVPKQDQFSELWRNTAEWRELALARRSQKVHEKLSEHTRDLKPLSVGDNVLVQNLLGNNPKRWDKRGVILEVLPHRQYKVKMDGSRRISLRNRKHLRKFEPLISEKRFELPIQDLSDKSLPEPVVNHPQIEIHSPPNTIPSDEEPLPQLMHPARNDSDAYSTPSKQHRVVPSFAVSPVTPSSPEQFYTPEVYRRQSPVVTSPAAVQTSPAVYINPTVGSTPAGDVAPQSPSAPVAVSEPTVIRRSSRVSKGQTSRFNDYATGGDFDKATEVGQVLYAVPLPQGFEQVSAIWNGYHWIQWIHPLAAEGR